MHGNFVNCIWDVCVSELWISQLIILDLEVHGRIINRCCNVINNDKRVSRIKEKIA